MLQSLTETAGENGLLRKSHQQGITWKIILFLFIEGSMQGLVVYVLFVISWRNTLSNNNEKKRSWKWKKVEDRKRKKWRKERMWNLFNSNVGIQKNVVLNGSCRNVRRFILIVLHYRHPQRSTSLIPCEPYAVHLVVWMWYKDGPWIDRLPNLCFVPQNSTMKPEMKK
jgi:hypothetical protein